MKRSKPKKLSVVLTLWVAMLMVSLNLLSTIVMAVVTAKGLNEKQNEFLSQTASNAKSQVEQFIYKYISVAELLAGEPIVQEVMKAGNKSVALSNATEFGAMLKLLQTAMDAYSDIMGIGFGSVDEDYLYTQAGTRLNTRLSERDYYEIAMRGTYVTQPYIDTATGEMCVSVAAPVYHGSNVEGILIVDLDMAQMSGVLQQLSFGESGTAVLLAQDNTIAGIGDHALLGKSFSEISSSKAILSELEEPDGKIVSFKTNGQNRKGTVAELSGGGWKVLSFMTSKEYYGHTLRTVAGLSIVLLANMIVVVGVVRFVIAKKLKPISELNEDLKAMSQGCLEITMNYESEDEIGEMAAALRICSENLSSYVREIDRLMTHLANSDLTAVPEVEFKGDFIPIQKAISESMEKLTDLMAGISNAADQVSASSNQVSDGAQTLAQGAAEQSSSVEELSNTIAELSVTVKENAKMAQVANENAVRVNGEIVESSEKMEQSLRFMEEIRTGAGKVDEIIKSIENIAFQTNILALNAAVEAARAGQAGKGFAVVADEVRNLAAKSAEASQATTELIGNMVSLIKKGSKSMQETKSYMNHVVEDAAQIMDVFQRISQASEHQSAAIIQVTQGADQISSVVQNNSATAEQSAAASEELSGQAQMLKNMISQFKI